MNEKSNYKLRAATLLIDALWTQHIALSVGLGGSALVGSSDVLLLEW